jgi:uncharacterized protein (TIGR02421 family)
MKGFPVGHKQELQSENGVAASVIRRLQQGLGVSIELPFGGMLHIDRPLPFLLLYRQPARRHDSGTDAFVRSEASYLVASGSPKFYPELAALLQGIIQILEPLYRAFLVIEIRSGELSQTASREHDSQGLSFRIITSRKRPPTCSVDALAKALKNIRFHRRKPQVSIELDPAGFPARLRPLQSAADAGRYNVYTMVLEVSPVFRDPLTGELYPLLLRSLQRGLSRALRRAFFEFSHTLTTYRPQHYHALGRKAVMRRVWEIDRKLADIGRSFDLVLHATPVNIEKAWSVFHRSRCDIIPEFYYRPLAVDPDLLKRQLFQVPVDKVEDPTLAFLFRQKRRELDRQLSMLLDRGKQDFLYGSLQLYGGIEPSLLEAAKDVLAGLGPHRRDGGSKKIVTARELALRAHEELDIYRSVFPDMKSRVEIRDDIIGLLVSRGDLYIGSDTKVSASRVEALVEHEVGTHILTYVNGSMQPFALLSQGFSGYDALQEGLAVLGEFFAGELDAGRMRLLAGRVIAAHCLVDGASFVDVWRLLNREYGFNQRTAFTIAIRIFRAGGLTKDAVYLRGLIALLDYLQKGGDLLLLFTGKIAIEHVSLIRELTYREVLKPPGLYPGYFRKADFTMNMRRLQDGMKPIDLVEQGVTR